MFWWGMDWLARWPIVEWHVIYLRMDNTSKLAWYVVLSSLLSPLPILRFKDLKLISKDDGNEVTKKKKGLMK